MTPTTPRGDSSEGIAFLQKRVAQFGLISAALGGIFWVFRSILAIAAANYRELTSASFALHGFGILFSLLLWFLCQNGARSRRFVESVEVGCLLASVFCYEVMGASINLDSHPELIVALALTLVMMTRAVFV